MLDYLESLGQSKELPLKCLTLKTVFLLVITRPSRSADIAQLYTKRMKIGDMGITFLPSTVAKQSWQGKPITEFLFPLFPENSNLCPVKTPSTYWDKTDPLHGKESKLFLSFVQPHKPVTSSTIARWSRTILEQAGIDTSVFGAHSTRGASSSAEVRGGVTTEDILKAANWSSESVIQKFYHKTVNNAAYGRAVIGSKNQATM